MKAIWNGKIVAESKDVINVEGNSYFPMDSVNKEYIKVSNLHTVCPWKGVASYYTLNVDEEGNKDAAWFYREPKDAAKRINGEWNSAAIAGDIAADLYDLEKVSEKIEDRPDNSTRFLIVGREDVLSSGDDKTSIIVASKNQPGALYKLLAPFYKEGIDLTRVETRPSREGKWTYVFFVDFKGHKDDPGIVKVLSELSQNTTDLRVLGSYPKAVL